MVSDLAGHPAPASYGQYSYGAILTPGILPPGSRVGRYCSVGGQFVVLRDHPLDRTGLLLLFRLLSVDRIPDERNNPPQIGHGAWIGDRVTILGNSVVVAVCAVMTRDVPI